MNCCRRLRPAFRLLRSCSPGKDAIASARADRRQLGTVASEEVDKFASEAGEWWSRAGQAQPLHAMNRLRVSFIRNALCGQPLELTGPLPTPDPAPLAGRRIVDVGCGPGILCEPLARLGAEVTGIEPAENSISVAKQHASLDPRLSGQLTYECTTVEDFAAKQGAGPGADLVVSSEVIEHVSNPPLFVKEVTKLVKPGGGCVFTTINRTQWSYAVAIVMAEYVLGAVTPGTHDWNKFVTPRELTDMLCDNHMTVTCIKGMAYNPLTNLFTWSSCDQVNYLVYAVKPSLEV